MPTTHRQTMNPPTTSIFNAPSFFLVILASGCATAPMQLPRGGKDIYSASESIRVEEAGIVARIMLPPREVHARSYIPFAGGTALTAGMKIDTATTRFTATECALIRQIDEQEYDLLLISTNQTSEAPGRAFYRVVLWNTVGIDWHAEILFEVSWESVQMPYAKVVYRNTRDDSHVFVENGSKEGSWKIAQVMKFGKGAPAKEFAALARDLSRFPRHRPLEER